MVQHVAYSPVSLDDVVCEVPKVKKLRRQRWIVKKYFTCLAIIYITMIAIIFIDNKTQVKKDLTLDTCLENFHNVTNSVIVSNFKRQLFRDCMLKFGDVI